MLELIVKRTKRSVSVVSKLPGATKNESICFSLFTLYFWLLSQRQFKKKNSNSQVAQAKASTSLSRGTFFSFLKTHTPSALAASADKIRGGWGEDRAGETKPNTKTVASAAASSQTV